MTGTTEAAKAEACKASSENTVARPKLTPQAIRAMKGRGEKIAALTAYDFPMTRLLDEVGVPLILVGDSLGMVVLGYEDTTQVWPTCPIEAATRSKTP